MNDSYLIENKKPDGVISKKDETILEVVQFSRRKPELETVIKSQLMSLKTSSKNQAQQEAEEAAALRK